LRHLNASSGATYAKIIEAWTAYREWAGNLDAEARFYIFAGSVLLLTMYVFIDLMLPGSGKMSPRSVKAKREGA
jgi:hypothetical protein